MNEHESRYHESILRYAEALEDEARRLRAGTYRTSLDIPDECPRCGMSDMPMSFSACAWCIDLEAARTRLKADALAEHGFAWLERHREQFQTSYTRPLAGQL